MILYIIRHGQPHYATGELTEKGWAQAEAVGERMAKLGINKIFASPILRAQQTAEPACRMLGLEKVTEEWSHEIGDERLTTYPDGQKKSVTLLQNTLLRENGEVDIPFEKTFETKALRETEMEKAFNYIKDSGREFLEKLGYKEENGIYRIIKPNDERIALFCHAVFTRTWLSHLLHIPMHIMWSSFAPTHTGVTIIEFKNNENGFTAPKCLCFSDMSHLYAEKVDMTHDRKIIV